MSNSHNSENLTDAVVREIHKDFTLVGKHRVHSWYAWAIVGIVAGMGLGIVYVANRSANFEQSQAAYFAPATSLSIGSASTEPMVIDLVSDGREKYSISVLPINKESVSDNDGHSEGFKYFVINPVSGEKVVAPSARARITVGGREFSVNKEMTRATALSRAIEGTGVTMVKLQGANEPMAGAKWISVRNTSQSANKIVANQQIVFTKNVRISGTVSSANINFEAPNLPTKLLINKQEVFSATAKSRQNNSLDIAKFLKQGDNEFRFELTQRAGGSGGYPFGLNYKGLIVLNAPVRPTAFLQKSFGPVSVKIGASNQKLASYSITNSADSDITIGKLILRKLDESNGAKLENLILKVDGKQFGQIEPVVNNGDISIGFTQPPITVSRGRSITIEAFANIAPASVSGTYPSLLHLEGWYLNVSGSTVSEPNFIQTIHGQTVTILSATASGSSSGSTVPIGSSTNVNTQVGQSPAGAVSSGSRPTPVSPTLSVSAIQIGTTPKLIAGTSNIDLLWIKLAADSNGDVIVRSITLTDAMTGANTLESFTNYGLWEGSGQVGSMVAGTDLKATGNRIPFKFAKQFIVGKSQSRTLILRGSVAAAPILGSQHAFSVANNSDIDAIGRADEPVIVNGNAPGQTLRIESLRVSMNGTAISPTTNRVRKTGDEVASISFFGSAQQATKLEQLTLTFSGTAVGAPFGVVLKTANGSAVGSAGTEFCTPDENSVCAVTFDTNLALGKGQSVNMRVLVNSTKFKNQANAADTLAISIAQPSDIGLSAGADTSLVGSLQIASVSYQ